MKRFSGIEGFIEHTGTDAVRNGDTTIEDIVGRAGREIGVAIVELIHLISSDTMILGGDARRMAPMFACLFSSTPGVIDK